MSSCWVATSKWKWTLWRTIPAGPCFTVINSFIWISASWRCSITFSAKCSEDSLELKRRRVLQSMLSRRQFAIGSAAAASGGLIGGFAGSRLAQKRVAAFHPALADRSADRRGQTRNAVKLKVSSGRHAFIKGKPTLSYGYSAPVLGPVIRLRRGDEVEMTVENALDVDTTVHWHGLLVPGDVDGGPHQVIKSGGTWRPRLKVRAAGFQPRGFISSAPRHGPTDLYGAYRTDHCR